MSEPLTAAEETLLTPGEQIVYHSRFEGRKSGRVFGEVIELMAKPLALERQRTAELRDALEAAEARERTLREALEFYACPANWRRENLGGGWVAEPLMDSDSDNGVRAQAALPTPAPPTAAAPEWVEKRIAVQRSPQDMAATTTVSTSDSDAPVYLTAQEVQ